MWKYRRSMIIWSELSKRIRYFLQIHGICSFGPCLLKWRSIRTKIQWLDSTIAEATIRLRKLPVNSENTVRKFRRSLAIFWRGLYFHCSFWVVVLFSNKRCSSPESEGNRAASGGNPPWRCCFGFFFPIFLWCRWGRGRTSLRPFYRRGGILRKKKWPVLTPIWAGVTGNEERAFEERRKAKWEIGICLGSRVWFMLMG